MRHERPGRERSVRQWWRKLQIRTRIAIVIGLGLGLLSADGTATLVYSVLQQGSHPTTTEANPMIPIAPVILVNPLIHNENALPGTTGWLIPAGHGAFNEIQGYADALSASPGQTITFYVSTQQDGTAYQVDVYRLGWYGGKGGRLLSTLHESGHAQGYYDWSNHVLVGCGSCTMDPATKLVEAHWQPSFTVTIAPDWVTGLYVAKLTDANDMQTYVSFEVRGNDHSMYLVDVSDATTAAYNDWGGYSLYHGPDQTIQTRAYKVSLNRPAIGWRFGFGNGISYEIDAIRWMERQGYDVSYISSVDLHEDPAQVLRHRAFISIGHDEYWSPAMRAGVVKARDAGVGLAFFGANAMYWRIRFEPDSQGKSDRTIVCYKDPGNDPLYHHDDGAVTNQWRLFPQAQPENAVVGIMYSDYDTPPMAFAWHLRPDAPTALLAGTGLHPGQTYGCNLVGYEWDKVFDNGLTPYGLQVLSESATVSQGANQDTSNSAYYIAPSGAMVFASGSIYWSYALDDLRISDVLGPGPNQACVDQSAAVPGIQALMAHVMDQIIIHHRVAPIHVLGLPSHDDQAGPGMLALD